jgi:hypothetical protein
LADNSIKYDEKAFAQASNTRPINPDTGTYFTDKQILDGCVGILNAIINSIGTDKLVIANGIYNGALWSNTYGVQGDNMRYIINNVPRLNGLTSEGTFTPANGQWLTQDYWKKSVDLVQWIQDNFINGNSNKYFNAVCDSTIPPMGANSKQVMLYGFCSMMLALKYSAQNSLYFGTQVNESPDLRSYSQTLKNANLGFPSAGYYRVASTDVYARDFSLGTVVVNPTATSFVITLNGLYSTLDGQILSGQITISPYTGMVLTKLNNSS